MDRKPSNSFEQIKPFLRMLERSIDDARHRRLGSPSDETPDRPSATHGVPAAPGPTTNGTLEGQFGLGGDRPQRATPIRPKTQIRPNVSNYPSNGTA
jgi:hypothetical protein